MRMCAWVGMQVSANVGRWVNVRVHVRVCVRACVRVCVCACHVSVWV